MLFGMKEDGEKNTEVEVGQTERNDGNVSETRPEPRGATNETDDTTSSGEETGTEPVDEGAEVAAEGEEDPLMKARGEARQAREIMLRVAADFENFRKRSRREVEETARRAQESILRELLPVFDNLERALAHTEQVSDTQTVADGVKMVLKQFADTLGRIGVQRIETVGTAFDPNVHEAIQQIPSSEQPPGTIVAEVLPGYSWGDRLVRAAMVVVAKRAETAEPANGGLASG